MKTGKVAKALGIDSKTITNWARRRELISLFSEGAKLEAGKAQRDFNMDDQLILNTIRHLRNDKGEDDWETIAAEIRSGFRQAEMPDSFYTTETTTSMQVYTQMIEIKNQLDLVLSERDQLRNELDKERERFKAELKEERERSEQKLKEERGEYTSEIIDLNRQIARLEVRMEIMQEDDED
jgi:DNA-binding transcriptional MerR regulator